MGKLKPVGSEKLEGLAKINRIMEIAKYNEHIPTPINETKSTEYSKTLSDGANYFIVKEKVGYVIKKGLNESTSDYIEPMKNRKYYNSYSQALKRLNLIAKEVNTNEGYKKNVSLFESDSEEEKYFLKMPTDEQAQPTAAAPAPAPAPAPQPAPAPAPEEEPMPEPAPEEEPMPEPEMDTEPDTDEDEEQVTFKTIQKLTGRLGQKIREFLSDEENQMTSKDVKYVINSVLSALDLNSLDEEDKEEIMMKFEGGEEGGMEDMSDIDMGDEEGGISDEVEGMGDETEPTPTEMPSSEEMGEEYGSISHRKMGSRKLSDRIMSKNESSKFEEMMEAIFSESKVENVLKKYFINEEKTKNHGKKIENTKKIIKKIKTLSESISQEVASRKFVQSNPEANLVGKTKNNNLVFKLNESTVRISPKGNIL